MYRLSVTVVASGSLLLLPLAISQIPTALTTKLEPNNSGLLGASLKKMAPEKTNHPMLNIWYAGTLSTAVNFCNSFATKDICSTLTMMQTERIESAYASRNPEAEIAHEASRAEIVEQAATNDTVYAHKHRDFILPLTEES